MDQNGCAFRCDYPPGHADLEPGCQFEDETAFFECGGKRYCRFHLPMADDSGQPTEKSSWLEAGEEGPELAAFRKTLEAHIEAVSEAKWLVNFSGVVFPGDIDFSGRALPDVLWYLARFPGRAVFDSVKFQGDAVFSDAEFQRGGAFGNAEFQGDADFTNGIFEDLTDFRGSIFRYPPWFHNAPLHQDTRFNPGDAIAKQFPNIIDDTAEQAYRTLKLHMTNNQAHREEQFFFRLEMRARARHERRWRRVLYGAYDHFSDYGHSIARPLVCWLVLLVSMTGVLAAASDKVAKTADLFALTGSDWMAAATMAASNALPISGFARQGLAQAVSALYAEGIPAWLPILATLHTVLSGVLLFLAVLALRNLFKMK